MLQAFFGHSVFWSKVIPNCMKKCQKRPKIVKKVSQTKKGISSCLFFLLKIFTLSRSKILQSFKPMAFMVLERSLGEPYLICCLRRNLIKLFDFKPQYFRNSTAWHKEKYHFLKVRNETFQMYIFKLLY